MTSARSRLPDSRSHELFDFEHDGIPYTVGVGRYGDGRIGEVFIDAHKTGTAINTQARDCAVLLSFMLQHGVPMQQVRHAMTRDRNGAAAGPIGALLDILFAGAAAEPAPAMIPPDLFAQPCLDRPAARHARIRDRALGVEFSRHDAGRGMSKNDFAESDVRQAAQINCGACDFCDGVHVNLIDEAGEVFATGIVQAVHWEPFIARFRDAMAEIRARSCPAPERTQ